MLKNYIKIALRNLAKNKLYSVLNIIGLSIGMVCTILLLLYVQDELVYDKHHPFAERTYRVAADINMMGQRYELAVAPAPLGKTFVTEFPEVVKFARFRSHGRQVINFGENNFKEMNAIFADNSVLEIFSIDLLMGDEKTALANPNTIIFSEKTAKKYFGDKNPIGEVIKIDNQYDYKVTGVFKEIPANTHFNFDVILSMESLEESREMIWLSNNFNTYIVLDKNADPAELEAKFPSFIKKYFSAQIEQVIGVPFDQLDPEKISAKFYLQPLTSIHLYSDLQVELDANGDIQYVYIFSIIAAFILIIAAINFVNISTARSAKRAKEVGIRKVLGSVKKELIGQFLTESLLTTVFAFVITLGALALVVPWFNELTGKELVINLFENPFLLILGMGMVITVGLLAGSYPAFILSSFTPVQVLSGKVKNATKNGNFRSGLVVFQFTIAIIMIISTIVVYNQLNFIQTKKLGFDKNHVVILNDAFLLGDNIKVMKNEMLKYPEVVNATISGYLPVPSDYNNSAIFLPGKQNEIVSVQQWRVDYDYISTMKIKIKKGRYFSKEFGNEEDKLIINEATARQFGFIEPLGKKIVRYVDKEGETKTYTIIGVVEDFHFESLRKSISPLIMFLEDSFGKISFRVEASDMPAFINKLRAKWNQLAPVQPFNYAFMDEAFNNVYFAEQRIGDVFAIFAGLAIFTGCLGLFSLSAFTAEEKTKEIGIRKVLGSTTSKIVFMLSYEFFKLIAISFVIATPIAFYVMHGWLQDYQYRSDLSVGIFVFAGLVVFSIAMITVSYHALKAANINLVKSLKYE
ncbi:MAG: ABC transporter permease [Melioribacteraceae bacterium]|nr:ABC transporter permease [Melioribacteraceae bacterium]